MGKILLSVIIIFVLCLQCYSSNIEGTNTYRDYLFILVHGIDDTESIWNGTSEDSERNLKSYLEKNLGLDGYVYAYSFSETNGGVIRQARELGDRNFSNPADGMNGKCWLEKAKEDFHSRFPDRAIPSKFILITHSMGNYAARIYIYSRYLNRDFLTKMSLNFPHEFYEDDIAKVVYLAPPLNGSDLALGAVVKYMVYYKQATGELEFWSDVLSHMSGYAFLYDPFFSYRVCKKYASYRIQGEDQKKVLDKMFPSFNPADWDFEAGKTKPWSQATWDLMPFSPITVLLKDARLSDDTKEPASSIVYGTGIPVINLLDSARLFGIKSFISDNLADALKKNVVGVNTEHLSLSLSDIYSPSDISSLAGKMNEVYTSLGSELNLIALSNFNSLSTAQGKFLSLTLSSDVAFTYDGDLAVPEDSAQGIGVRAVRNARRYAHEFTTDGFNNYLERDLPLEVGLAIASYYAMVGLGVPSDAAIQIQWVPVLCFMGQIDRFAADLKEDFRAHGNITKQYDLITTALLDTPGIFTLYSLQCPVSVETEAVIEETKPMVFSVSGVVPANYEVIKVRSADQNRVVANAPIQPVPSTLDEDRKYLTQVLVTKVPKRVTGKLNYLIPAKMQQFEYSFNFQAWQPITGVNPESGEFALDDLHFAEGQNLLAIRSINAVGVPYHQLMKVIVNTIPMQASKYLPESNFMTNNVYQPIGVEFNKSTYYEDVAGMINIVTFEVDGISAFADANITSEIDGAYHPYARVNYTPQEPLQDGPHNIVVKAKSDVGVSQAIWSFFVDTQPPTITIEALAPYSPRAPNAQPISIRYKTADNLSTFLRNLSAKVYDSKNNLITEITTYDTQAVGENYIQWGGKRVTSNGEEIVPDGNYTIKIQAYDYAGNATEESVALTIDSTPPTILNADVNPKPMTSNSDSMNFSSELSEDSIVTIKMINKSTNVASAYISQASGAEQRMMTDETGVVTVTENPATASYSWSYNNQFGISGPEDGVYKLEVTAQDKAGNVSDPYSIDNVRIDRTPPIIFANACLPYVLANVGDNPYTTMLSYQMSESNDKAENRVASGQGFGVSVKLFNENTGEMIKMWSGSDAPADIGPVNSINWNGNSSQYGNGAYKFAITATDAYGNSSTAYSTCVKDGIAPVISFPAKDQVVSGSIAIRGVAMDPDWTNNLPFKSYRIYYAKGVQSANGLQLTADSLPDIWKYEFIEVPEINRDEKRVMGNEKNLSIRPLQNDSTLAYLYSNGLENGTYTLLLIAEEDGGQSLACTRVIEVHNDPMMVSIDVPVVRLNPLPQKVHFTADGKVELPISFINGIKKSNVNIEVLPLSTQGRGARGEGVVFYKYQPGVVGNQYTGKPSYQAGQNLGYYIWTDKTGWHIRWSSDGTSHHFTGNLMGSGISNIKTINWNPSGQIQSFINWDNSISNGEAGIDFNADSGAMLIITPKIDEDPNTVNFAAKDIYLGMTKALPTLPIVMINASMEGVAPEVVNWDGKLETGGFADSGVYTVRVRSEGADGIGLATDEAQVEVETDYDVSNVEAVNKSFSPVGAPDRVSIYYNVSKDSYITAYVYQNPVISLPLPLPNTDGTLVATITSEAFVMGNLNPNHRHVLTWRGNYPNPDSSQFYTGGGFNIKIVTTAADGSGQKTVPVGGISIINMETNASIAALDPIGDEVPFNGTPQRIANGSSGYYFEAKGNGRLFPPKAFSFSLSPYGKQMPITYPYVPFAMLVHRGYKQVDTRMDVYLSGTIREKYLPANDTQWHTDYIDYSSLVKSGLWSFRDEAPTNEVTSIGSSCVFGIRVLSDQVADSRPLVNGLEKLSRDAFAGMLLFGSGNVRDSQLWFWGDQMITINVYTKGGIEGDPNDPNFILDTIRIPASYLNKYVPSDKGIFKAIIIADDSDRYHFRVDVQVELEAPIKYSRLTNRFMPFFGFVNKNYPALKNWVDPKNNIEELGFPGDTFFNSSEARPYNEFDEMLQKAAEKADMSVSDLVQALSKLETQKNYIGYLTTTECTKGWKNYLSDPITKNDGIEFINITDPDKGSIEAYLSGGGMQVTASTTYEMSYNSNPPSLFALNFPASEDEKNNFTNRHAQLLYKFKKSPSLWTEIGVNSPHELDTSTVCTSVETVPLLGQVIKYGPDGYNFLSQPLGEIYDHLAENKIPANAYNIKYSWGDISDQSVTLSLDNTTEASGGAQLRGTITGDQGLRWTTEDDPMLYPYGGVIRSRRLPFNKDGFSGRSEDLNISETYVTGEVIGLQNMGSPNMIKYTFWKYNALTTTIDAYDPIDNQYLVYDDWNISLKDLSGAENSDLVPLEVIKGSDRLQDKFSVKLKLDSAEKKFVEIRGKAVGNYTLMYFDGVSWKTIYQSVGAPSEALAKEGTLGWWNVSRLNGKYTVLLKVGNVISTKDVLIGSIVRPQNIERVTSPYKRAEVIFQAGTFPDDKLVTVTPVRMDEIDISNRPLIPTVGPIVEVKPSPYYFTIEAEDQSSVASAKEDMRPTLVFRYTKDDLKEMYPYLNIDDPTSVEALGLNIHQITEKGDLQIISNNKQSYNEGLYAFEGPLDHFSDYALIRGRYNLKAPVVLTDKYIVNTTPITVYGTAQAESILNVYVSASKEIEINSLEPIAARSLGSDESGIAAFKFEKVPLIIEGNNYIFVTSTQGNATTESSIIVKYDITPPTAEASANIPAFSPNGDGKFDVVDYTIKSNETGKLYFIIKDPKGDTVLNKEFDCKMDEGIKVEWDGTDQNSNHCSDGDYTLIAFAVDEAGNISNNVTGQTIIDTVPPKVSKISVNPYSFTPNDDGINDTATISFEVNEPSYATLNIYRNSELFFNHGMAIGSLRLNPDIKSGQAVAASNQIQETATILSQVSWAWDGRGSLNELIGGTYTFNIVAEDSVGNISTSETSTVYVDRAAFLVDYAYCDPMYFSPYNPRNDRTKIKYSLSRDDLKVDINIYDGLGNVIASPTIGETKKAGVNESIWDGSDKSGNKVQNGTYGFKVRAVDPVDGASGEVTGNVIVDNDPPTIAINRVDVLDDSAMVTYSIPEESKVTISVVDQSDQIISELVTSETLQAGSQQVEWLFGQCRDSLYGCPSPGQGPSFAPLRTGRQALSLHFKIYAEDKALNSDEKTSSSFTVPGPLEIYDASASPAIFNPNSQIINKYTTIKYRLAEKSGRAQVTIKALSQAGATIKTLEDGEDRSNGVYSLIWYGDDFNNLTVSAGDYTVQISAVDDLGNSAKVDIPVTVASDSSSVISVSPEVFSPNADGVADTTLFTYSVDYYWQLTGEAQVYLEIYGSAGDLIYTYSNHHSRGMYTYLWDNAPSTYETYTARIRLVDPAGTIVYSNVVSVKADLGAGSALPEEGFVSGSPFTPNCDGQGDSASFTYSIDEPSYVTVNMHKYNGAGPYDASNHVWTICDHELTNAGTWSAVWYGSSEAAGDADGNGYVERGKYAFILETIDPYGNVSPKRGATVWVLDVPLVLQNQSTKVDNPTPKVFSGLDGQTAFNYQLTQLISGEYHDPEKIELLGMRIKDLTVFNIGKVTVKLYDQAGNLVRTVWDKHVVQNIPCSGEVTCEGSGLSEGIYTFIASAEDMTGVPSLNSMSGVTYVDSTPPVISGVSLSRNCFSPGLNSVTVSYEASDNLSSITTDVPNRIRITIKVYDPLGGLAKTITDIPSLESGTSSSSIWDGSLDSGSFEGSGKPDGKYAIKISAVDVAGNTAEAAQDIIVDTTKPSIESVSVSPNPFSPGGAKPNSNISANITDSNSITWEVKIETGASPVVSTGSGTSINYIWNGMNGVGSYPGDGVYNCVVNAYDSAGNSNQITKIITADTIAPVITAEARPKVFSANMDQLTTLEVKISDANPHLTYNISIGSGSTGESSESNYVHDYITWIDPFRSREADGDYNFVVVATDEAGNTASTIETVSLDNTPPTAEFTSPVGGSWQKGTFEINGTITDSHPGNYTLCYSGGIINSGSGEKAGELLGTFNSSALNSPATVYLIATDEVGNHTAVQNTFNVDNTPPVISSITIEAGGVFNPYTDDDGNMQISFEVTDNSTGYLNQKPSASITAFAEVWLGTTLVYSLTASKYGTSEVIWTTEWDGKNKDGNYVNEGDYTLRLTAADILNNISTYEYTIKLEDDQQMTSLEGGSYSHDPNLTLSGTDLNLRFITGESWGSRYLESKIGLEAESGIDAFDVGYFTIEKEQNIPVTAWSTGSSVHYSYIYGSNDNLMFIWSGGDVPPATEPFPADRYRVCADGKDSTSMGVTSVTGVTYNEPKYNCKFLTSDLCKWNLLAESSLKTFEASVSYMSGTMECEHCVWPAIRYSSDIVWSPKFNDYEIIYNQKTDGAWRKKIITGSGHYWRYPEEIRITSAEGDSINPVIACDSSGQKVYVVWEDYRTDNKGKIYLKTSTNEGNSWLPSLMSDVLIASSSGNCMMPSIAVDDNNNFYIAYIDDSNGGHKELFVKKGTVNISGSDVTISWVGTARITRHEFLNCEAMRPSIVRDSSGDAYVAWEDTRTGTSEIFFQKIPSKFAPFSGSGMTTMSMPSQPVIAAPVTIMSVSSTIELISPINGSTVNSLRPTFRWYGATGIASYELGCATTSDADAIFMGANIFTTYYVPSDQLSLERPLCDFTISEHSMGLDESTPSDPYHYWRVRTLGTSEVVTSEVGSFRIELPVSLSSVINWPNPFDPNKEKTKIRYRLGREADNVTIRIYDITGALVRELDGTCNAEGSSIWNKYNDVEWDGKNGRGDMVLNGVYPFEVSVTCGNKTVTGRGKIVVLK